MFPVRTVIRSYLRSFVDLRFRLSTGAAIELWLSKVVSLEYPLVKGEVPIAAEALVNHIIAGHTHSAFVVIHVPVLCVFTHSSRPNPLANILGARTNSAWQEIRLAATLRYDRTVLGVAESMSTRSFR